MCLLDWMEVPLKATIPILDEPVQGYTLPQITRETCLRPFRVVLKIPTGGRFLLSLQPSCLSGFTLFSSQTAPLLFKFSVLFHDTTEMLNHETLFGHIQIFGTCPHVCL